MKNIILSALIVGLVAVGFTAYRVGEEKSRKLYEERLGSVAVANEYYATTTGTQALWPNYKVLKKSVNGSALTLGSIIITTSGTSPMCFHDATSTETNALWATTTIACFQASASVGNYVFDVVLQKGLLVEFTGSPTGTSRASTTITWR